MQVDLDALEAAEAKAPPGPWRMSPWHIEEGSPCVRAPEGWNIAITSSDDNAAFIAAIRNAAPSLIKELREARKRIADLENGIRFISAGVPVLQDMLATLKMSGANKAAEMVECARLLQPAKETP